MPISASPNGSVANAGPAYYPISTTTLGSNQATVTINLPSSGYTDIIVMFQGTNAGGNPQNDMNMIFNSDNGNNYSLIQTYGSGGGAGGTDFALGYSAPALKVSSWVPGPGKDANWLGSNKIEINNYLSTTHYRTVLSRWNNFVTSSSLYLLGASMGVWKNNTNAVSTVTFSFVVGNFAAGSIFSVYGLKAA
jgi:hypothetical protein